MAAEVGRPAPDFTMVNHRREMVSLSDLKGKKTLIVFYPFAFSGVCEGELCTIRDNLHTFEAADANVVAVSCDPFHAIRVWSEQEDFGFTLLSDFWPHGEVTRAYGCFNDKVGCAMRATYVLDEEGIVRAIISTEDLGQPREFDSYQQALASL